jgi:small conductance mechanosensitive channel
MLRLLDFWILLIAFLNSNIQVYGVKAIRILLIFVGLVLTEKISNRLISGLIGRIPGTWNERRTKTLRGVIQNLLRYALYFVGVIMILSELNVNTGSILAGVGVVGLAVGIGAQSLVKDVVNGFFILFEDQFAVGDYVNIAGVTGTVEDMGLRVTKIREATGDLHIISNGEITQVTRLHAAKDGK